MLGFCGPWALSGVYHLPGNIRDRKRRLGDLAAMAAVPGRVVAVLRSVTHDPTDGNTWTSLMPVVAFTTLDGKEVTAYCESGLPDPAGSRDLDVTVHYAPADPAVFVLDVEAERRSWKRDMAVDVVGVLVVAAAAVVGRSRCDPGAGQARRGAGPVPPASVGTSDGPAGKHPRIPRVPPGQSCPR
ncbi:DUF3592 domain-containing protein [Spirillospora sp. NPDC046719]